MATRATVGGSAGHATHQLVEDALVQRGLRLAALAKRLVVLLQALPLLLKLFAAVRL